MYTTSLDPAVSPIDVGDIAPDFDLLAFTGERRWLSDYRGLPVVVAFHPPHWDPTLADQLAQYKTSLASRLGESVAEAFLVRNDDVAAMRFGVGGARAVFVIDADGTIAWRHVDGVDPMPAPDDVGARTSSRSFDSRCNRRQFVAIGIGAALAVALSPTFKRASALGAPIAPKSVGDAKPVTLNVNGRSITLTLEPRVTLLDALREYAGLTGTKKGCDHGQCGACTVHIDGRRVLSCLTLAMMAQGKPITTIEGLAHGDELHPVQQAFIEHDGFQCGYCTPGQIMSASAMLHEPWGPSDDDVREAMSGNICRCGAYLGIVAAIQDARGKAGGPAK